jgi:RNA polymerase sigma-70 factor (ECF subfamily)
MSTHRLPQKDRSAMTDGELLERYAVRRDEGAFATLVERHGPMVWGVCRRVLHSHHDAEDAFQATFLVLARRAASVMPREMVANWLFGVARQTALKARGLTARNNSREKQVAALPEQSAAEQGCWDDLFPILDRELTRLPRKYRAVVVLCDLEGKTRKEAARELGVPEGSVAGWLARARALLAQRLAREGAVVSGVVLATWLSREIAAAADAPTALAARTATLFGQGSSATTGAISPQVSLLAGKVTTMLFLAKAKVVAAVVLAVVVLGAIAGLAPNSPAQETRPPSAGEKWRDQEQAELAQLAGTWALVSQASNGQALPSNFKLYRFTFARGRTARLEYEMDVPNEPSRKEDNTFSMSLNPAKSPKEINFYKENFLVQGIYKLEGNRLTICHLGISEADRPQGFTVADSGSDFMPLLVWVLKRE